MSAVDFYVEYTGRIADYIRRYNKVLAYFHQPACDLPKEEIDQFDSDMNSKIQVLRKMSDDLKQNIIVKYPGHPLPAGVKEYVDKVLQSHNTPLALAEQYLFSK